MVSEPLLWARSCGALLTHPYCRESDYIVPILQVGILRLQEVMYLGTVISGLKQLSDLKSHVLRLQPRCFHGSQEASWSSFQKLLPGRGPQGSPRHDLAQTTEPGESASVNGQLSRCLGSWESGRGRANPETTHITPSIPSNSSLNISGFMGNKGRVLGFIQHT